MEIINLIFDIFNSPLFWMAGILFFLGYTWVAKDNDDYVLAAHINELQTKKLDNDTIAWSGGELTILTDVGTNTHTLVHIKGKGTGYGQIKVFNTDDDSYIQIGWITDYQPAITVDSTPNEFNILHNRPIIFRLYGATTGGNAYVYIHGYKTAVGRRYLRLRVDADGFARIESEDGVSLAKSGGKLGFYGLATPIALQTGVAVDAAGIHAALVALNLITA